MAEFVQIGDQAFNPEQVVAVVFEEEKKVYLALSIPTRITFTGDEYDLFLKWWECKANVDKVV